MTLVLIFVHIVLPVLSVFLYERIKGYKLPVLKRISLYFIFACSVFFVGYAAISLYREQLYHEWLFTELLSFSGLLVRLVIPVVSAAVLPVVVLLYRKPADLILKDEIFDRKPVRQYGHCAFSLFTALFIMFVFSPVYIAVGALTALQTTELLTVTLILAGVSLLLGAGVFLLWGNYKYIEGWVSGLLVLCFINALVIPFQAEILDGRQEFAGVWENPMPLIRSVILLVVLSGVFTALRKQLRFTVIPLAIIVTVFTISNINTMNAGQTGFNDDGTVSQEELFKSASTLSTGRNVIVIVLDQFQGSIAERTFEEYPQFLDSFDGFTVFTRAFSSFSFTQFSDVLIHSGDYYVSEDPSWQENLSRSFTDSFMMDIKNKGFSVSLLGSKTGSGSQTEFPFIHSKTLQQPWVMYNSASSASLARVTGYWMQSPFSFLISTIEGDWAGSRYARAVDRMVNDADMMERLISELDISSEQDKLLYFWNFGTHTPVVFSRDGQINVRSSGWSGLTERHYIREAYFFFDQLSRLFENMKELGVYDNSLIVIVSDHGTYLTSQARETHLEHIEDFYSGAKGKSTEEGRHRLPYSFNTALLVKPPGSAGQASITHDPAWTGDVRAVVNSYYDGFSTVPPVDMIAAIRAQRPVVGVMYSPKGISKSKLTASSEHHEFVYITSLHELEAAFNAFDALAESSSGAVAQGDAAQGDD